MLVSLGPFSPPLYVLIVAPVFSGILSLCVIELSSEEIVIPVFLDNLEGSGSGALNCIVGSGSLGVLITGVEA